jgi:glycosyltransferase involved in cell wall biosynthesis
MRLGAIGPVANEAAKVNSSLRVCRLVSDYPVGGKPTYGLQPVYYYLSREQARMGHDVQVIAHRVGNQPIHEITDGVEIHRVAKPFTYGTRRMLKQLVDNGRDSVVHSHATAGSYAIRSIARLGAPVVSHVHGTSRSAYMPADLEFEGMKLNYSPVKVTLAYIREMMAWRRADRLVSVSSAVKNDLATRYKIPKSRIDVVLNGADPDLFRHVPDAKIPGLPGLEGKRVVLYVGHFGLRKGILNLIRAMKDVNAEVPDSVLVCIGGVPAWLGKGDYWAFLKGFAQRCGIDGKVFLLDKIPNEALPVYYSGAEVFVLPSYYEAFAKVVIEAMACEIPIVATRMGGNLDAVGSDAGLLVEFGDSRGIARAVITVLQDRQLAKRMGANGRQRVLQSFTWRAVATRIEDAYAKAQAERVSK